MDQVRDEIKSARPERYLELAACREQIQFVNRKFRWPSVYLFDTQTGVHAASRKDAQAHLDVFDTTILNASALRLHPKQCIRCTRMYSKSFDHLVRDCPFLAQEKPKEAASSPSKPSANGTLAIDSWNLQNYQRIYNILQCPGAEKMSHPIYLT